MSSDFLDLTPRDNYIGWERVAKTQRMINHTCIGSTIVPIQPLRIQPGWRETASVIMFESDTCRKDLGISI